MDKQKKTISLVILVNIIVASLSQILFYSIVEEKFDVGLFQFGIHPILIVIVNIIMGLKFKMKFYVHSLSAYVGFFISTIINAVILLFVNKAEELPPGEMVLHADVLFIGFLAIIQIIILLILNLVIFIVYKLFSKKVVN